MNQRYFERALRDAPVQIDPVTKDASIILPTELVGIIVPHHRHRVVVPGGYLLLYDEDTIAELAADALLDPNQDAPVVKRKIALLRRITLAEDWREIEQKVSEYDAVVRNALDLPPGLEPIPA